ncbi:MAG: trans-sulfuration enzyme family protein, partial [Burkholderiales bacterium]
VRAAIQPGKTKLIWIETPANPLWHITDIAAMCEIAHAAGALVAVDSTCATPVLTRPIEHGADIVMHAATKYLNGHSDVVAGTLTVARDSETWQRVKAVRVQIGGIAGPFEAWLLTRGMRTLFPRVRTACAGAQRIAEHFSQHPLVEEVLYPGLPEFVGHQIAAKQMHGGFGGMMSIRVKHGEAAAIAVAANTQLWKRATSLGGVESLIEHRSSVEGEGTPAPKDLLRMSVGIEATQDLIDDFEQALTAASR